ncbi:MAG TPA: hypothetical protein VKD04_06360 [Burkholderiales bacterium]|nr:hypothetical protein [Burkholderiales bacterium]
MKSFAWKILFCLLAGIALAGCVDLDVQGRGHIGGPPEAGPGPNVGERRHADDQGEDEDREKHKHKHKDKHKEDDNGDDDDGDDHHQERRHKD